jgi:hypothetical protein
MLCTSRSGLTIGGEPDPTGNMGETGRLTWPAIDGDEERVMTWSEVDKMQCACLCADIDAESEPFGSGIEPIELSHPVTTRNAREEQETSKGGT